ncbi:glycine cleavage system protein H, partial [Burkholderia multivorans]
GLVNSDPYGEGWLFEVNVDEVGVVMDADSYAKNNSL